NGAASDADAFHDQAVISYPDIVLNDDRRDILGRQRMRPPPEQIIDRMAVVIEYFNIAGQPAIFADNDRMGDTDSHAVIYSRSFPDNQPRFCRKLQSDHPGLPVADGDIVAYVDFAAAVDQRRLPSPDHVPADAGAAIGHDLAAVLVLDPAPGSVPGLALSGQQRAEQARRRQGIAAHALRGPVEPGIEWRFLGPDPVGEAAPQSMLMRAVGARRCRPTGKGIDLSLR